MFPAFLLLYYALRGRWRIVIGGILTVGALIALTVAFLGVGAYRDYLVNALPAIQWFRVGWKNDSIWGFWSRLFDPAPEHLRDRSLTDPLYYSPALATCLSAASCLAVSAILTWQVRRNATTLQDDLTFSLAATAMLLVSPICSEHYVLLLLVPLREMVSPPANSQRPAAKAASDMMLQMRKAPGKSRRASGKARRTGLGGWALTPITVQLGEGSHPR
jgi:alpha-1,2-mannosyltransferase